MSEPIIEVENVSFSYRGLNVLSDVSFAVREKEFLAFIGPNGGGKTTLIKLLLGLLKPDTGTIRIYGTTPEKAAHLIGYVPQDVAINKSFPISVLDVVLMGRLRFRGRFRLTKADKEAARKVLSEMEMLDYQNRRIDDLSGGQRERVFIARALATDPDILILDEPTASLDNAGRTELYAILKEINKSKTILLVTHDMMVLSSYVSSVACVNQNVHYHDDAEITEEMIQNGYHCPVELIAHGIPHRILKTHKDQP
ncbi:MAG: metal ABC transporter ATP-binding protein [Desulfobacterales bacterium]